MNAWGFSLVLLLGAAAGCQSAAGPAEGLAGLRVRVTAEPKRGVPVPSDQVPVFDQAAHRTSGAFERLDYSSLDNIVVWAEPVVPADMARSPAPQTMNIRGPIDGDGSIVAASVGQELVLSNSGSQALDLYSVSDGNDFELGSIAPGQKASYVIKSAGLIEILTGRSEQPLARVYAVPSRFVAKAHSGAEVIFSDLPPGDYRVCSWHPRLPGSVIAVHLNANRTQSAAITVGVNSLPEVNSH